MLKWARRGFFPIYTRPLTLYVSLDQVWLRTRHSIFFVKFPNSIAYFSERYAPVQPVKVFGFRFFKRDRKVDSNEAGV